MDIAIRPYVTNPGKSKEQTRTAISSVCQQSDWADTALLNPESGPGYSDKTTKSSRLFLAQASSLCPKSTGFDSPYDMVEILAASMP